MVVVGISTNFLPRYEWLYALSKGAVTPYLRRLRWYTRARLPGFARSSRFGPRAGVASSNGAWLAHLVASFLDDLAGDGKYCLRDNNGESLQFNPGSNPV